MSMPSLHAKLESTLLGSLPSIKWMDMDHDDYCVPRNLFAHMYIPKPIYALCIGFTTVLYTVMMIKFVNIYT